jgi:hypothetical protein
MSSVCTVARLPHRIRAGLRRFWLENHSSLETGHKHSPAFRKHLQSCCRIDRLSPREHLPIPSLWTNASTTILDLAATQHESISARPLQHSRQKYLEFNGECMSRCTRCGAEGVGKREKGGEMRNWRGVYLVWCLRRSKYNHATAETMNEDAAARKGVQNLPASHELVLQ